MPIKEYNEYIYLEPNIVSESRPEKRVVTIKSRYHRGAKRYMIFFHFDKELIDLVKKMDGIKWSDTNKAWYLDNNPENMKLIFATFRGYAWIDASAVFENKGAGYYDIPVLDDIEMSWFRDESKPVPDFLSNPMADDIKAEFESFRTWMQQMRYSESTINTYTDSLSVFFRYYHEKGLKEITNDDLNEFNANYIIAGNLSASYQNQIISAIRLFFEEKQNIVFDISVLQRPRRYRKLPKVIAKQDIEKMLKIIKNQKHKIALTMIYACGLRRNELINLKVDDICFKRKTLSIINAKGQKDRVLPLRDCNEIN
ncbi:MAG: phage integrase N-terminal SAM-like domain-containing protein [Bacteroidia bacterium]|nr:phage integrase N-terminal SAM-like domain-containing protein [Bacteroidia bacterium]